MLELFQGLRQPLLIILIYNQPIHFFISHKMAHSECSEPNVFSLRFSYRSPNVMVFGSRACGVIKFGSVMRGDTLMISAATRRYTDQNVRVPSPLSLLLYLALSPFHHIMCKYSKKAADCKAGGLSPGSDNVRTSIVDLQSSRTVANKYVMFKPPNLWYFVTLS